MTLPIEIIPNTAPPRFKWRQAVSNLGGGQTIVEHDSMVPVTMESSLVMLVKICKKMAAFKDWVHAYLDAQGVPKEFPNGKHTKEGCRIGDRLDWLVAQSGKQQAAAITTVTCKQAPPKKGKVG